VIELDVQLTLRDVHLMRWGVGSRRWRPWAIGLVALALVNATDRHLWEVPALVAVVIAAILVANRLVVRRAFRSSSLLRDPQHWTIDESGLRCETTRDDGEVMGETRYEWHALDRVVDARDAFLLFISARACMVIPKRCFSSTADIDQLRALAAGRGLL
jgi:YcxB-like protein